MPQTSFTVDPAKGVSGQIADLHAYRSSTGINGSATPLQPGRFVCRNSTVAGREKEARPPAAAADVLGGGAMGFVIHRDIHVNPLVVTNVDRAYIQQTETFPYMEEGYMFVQCETAWTAGGRVYVRHTANGLNTVLGAVRNDVDAIAGPTNTAEALVMARFEDTGSAAGIAKIKFDVRPTA